MIAPLASAHSHASTRKGAHVKIHGWQRLLLHPDIANCLAFSKLRCVISIISILLLATDIPRSGLGVRRLDDYYPALIMPDNAVRFGPYAYPVRHIWRTEVESFYGLQGAEPVDSANVWSYKYDTTSLGLRGAAELLNVTGYPDFLLYKGELGRQNNHHAVLSLKTTFLMLDAFIAAARDQRNVLRFATRHNWVDRVHHYLTRSIRQSRIWSLHSLHVPDLSFQTNSLDFCTTRTRANAPLRPRFCSYPGTWESEHPVNSSLAPVRLPQHMDIRFQDLQRRYPDLLLDVALISTHRPSMTSGTLAFTFFNGEEQEIVMLTRGRNCTRSENRAECSTIFVDDYRYERNILQTNVVDWYFSIAALRAGAQGYFWARLFLLYNSAFVGTASFRGDKQHWSSRVVSAVMIVFKIPFQVIVYSSLLPVGGYVLALFLDGNFMDIFLDSYWTTLEGATNFEMMTFLNSAVTQMRTVWLMALLVDLMVLVARKPTEDSGGRILGIRGLAISFTSALTIIGPYRHTTFRNSKIVTAIRLANVGQTMDTVQSSPRWFFNESTYLFDDSMTMLFFCVAAVALAASAAKVVIYFTRADQGLVVMSTLNAPHGTELLWPTSSLSIRFNALTGYTPYQYDLQGRPSVIKVSSVFPLQSPTSERLSEVQFSAPMPPGPSRWRVCRRQVAPTKPSQPPNGGLCSRTVEFQSILQLMNIAMMTDPWNFFWLRVLGVPLFLYRIRPTSLPNSNPDSSNANLSYAVILPYATDEVEERTGQSSDSLQLLDMASSRNVPMYVVLQSG